LHAAVILRKTRLENKTGSLAFHAAVGQINHAFINNSNSYEELRQLPGSNILCLMTLSSIHSLPA